MPLLLKCFLAYLRKYGDGGDGRGVGERRRWRKDGGLSKGEEVREGESGKVRDREGEVG